MLRRATLLFIFILLMGRGFAQEVIIRLDTTAIDTANFKGNRLPRGISNYLKNYQDLSQDEKWKLYLYEIEQFLKRYQKSILGNMEWKIKGQKLYWGSKPITFKADSNQLDTLWYRLKTLPNKLEKSDWIALITNFREAGNYSLALNCESSFFEARDAESNQKFENKVLMTLAHPAPDSAVYLIKLFRTAAFVTTDDKTALHDRCSKKESTNAMELDFFRINVCNEKEARCTGYCCLNSDDGEHKEVRYQILETIFQWKYIPFSNEPLKISYDPISKEVEVK